MPPQDRCCVVGIEEAKARSVFQSGKLAFDFGDNFGSFSHQ
jgi:hypothetical protein